MVVSTYQSLSNPGEPLRRLASEVLSILPFIVPQATMERLMTYIAFSTASATWIAHDSDANRARELAIKAGADEDFLIVFDVGDRGQELTAPMLQHRLTQNLKAFGKPVWRGSNDLAQRWFR